MATSVSARTRTSLLLLLISLFLCSTLAVVENGSSEPGNGLSESTKKSVLKLDYNRMATARAADRRLNESMHDIDRKEVIADIIVDGHCDLANLTALEELIKSRSDELSDFHWNMYSPMPVSMLKTLDSIPSLRLHYDLPPGQSSKQDRQATASSRSLYALKSHIMYNGDSNFEDLRHVHDILATNQNLRVLDLTLSHHGCVVSENPWAFDFKRDTRKFPPLERLKLAGYELDNLRNGEWQSCSDNADARESYILWPWKHLPRWAQDYFWEKIYDWGGVDTTAYDLSLRASRAGSDELKQQLEPHNLDAWLEVMDWSKLKMLALDRATPKILQRLSSVTQSLEHFVLASGEEMVASELPAFINNFTAPLRSLSLSNIMFDHFDDLVEAITSSANSTLSLLTVAEHEEARMRYCMSDWSEAHCAHKSFGTWYLPQPFLNPDHLKRIAGHVHNLTHLELGVARSRNVDESSETNETRWSIDMAAVNAAALIPGLRNLTIAIESPDHLVTRVEDVQILDRSDHRAFKDPTLNRTSVPDLFRHLNDQRMQAGLEHLHELVIKVGEWDNLASDWGMMGPPRLLAGNWVCQVDEHGMPRCYGGNVFVDRSWGYRNAGLQDPYSVDWTVNDETVQNYDYETSRWDYENEVVIPWD